MPNRTFADISDLPENEVAQYSRNQRAAFKRAYNRAIEKRKKPDEALREAHIAAKHEDNGNT